MRKLRVCMLIPSYFPLVGGSEVQLSGLLKKLDGRRIDAVVLTRRLKGTPAIEKQGIATIIRRRAPLRPASFFYNSLAYLLRKRNDFDILHVHSFDSPALAGAIVKRRFPEKRFILRVPRFGDGSAFVQLQDRFLGRMRLRFVLNQADSVIPLCEDTAAALQSFGFPEEKVAHVPNGVDVDAYSPPSDEEKASLKASIGIGEDAFVGVFVGRLIPRRNVMGILKMWQNLVRTHPQSVLLVIGTGAEESRLKAYARENLQPGAVVFFGAASRDTVPKLLKASDVYVSASTSEGISNSMLEALSTGLPVIAWRGPGIDSLIQHGEFGFLLNPGDPSEGASHLRTLSEDRGMLQAMSRAARRLITAKFSFDIVAKQIEAIYFDGRRSGARLAPTATNP